MAFNRKHMGSSPLGLKTQQVIYGVKRYICILVYIKVLVIYILLF